MALRQLIVRLLRTQDRRIEKLEDQGAGATELLREIKGLLVETRRDLDEYRGHLIKVADEHGGAIRRNQQAIMEKESRLAHVERRLDEQSGELDELKGTVMRIRVEHANGSA